MSERMKIMIPYDGSINAEIALGALRRRADYSNVGHDALVVISDVWLADSAEEFTRVANARRRRAAKAGALSYAPALSTWEEERFLSREALDRVTSMFPLWNVEVATLPGFSLVSSEILETADRSNTDVIAIGTHQPLADRVEGHGRAALRVAKEASCDVFLASGKRLNGNLESRQELATRIALVLDGRDTDELIVQAAACRKWPESSQARVILSLATGSSISETQAAEALKASGLDVSFFKPQWNLPAAALPQALIDWTPDVIFACADQSRGDEECSLNSKATDILLRGGYSLELTRKSRRRSKAMRAAA
jgi:nucleotide-binding universal stress UspA family protein